MIKQNIIDDMQMPLDAGRCPRCSSNLSLNKMDGKISCQVCGLEIVDSWMISDRISDSNEESDMETHLMPDEATIASKEPRMQWQEAVTTVDNVIQEWLIDHDGQSEERVTNVLAAWHRILQG
tara:strand:- start:3877 stop:4245 length:369 start_codon:yes stop_codon:yes gene_type:complete